MSATAKDKCCACVSSWVSGLGENAKKGKCSHCGTKNKKASYCGSLLVSCSHVKGRVHAIAFMLHEKCVPLFEEAFGKKKRNLLYDKFFMLPEHIPRSMMEEYRMTCLEKHKPLLSRCGSCGTNEQQAVRFDHCSGCKSVSYCDEECQNAAWPAHRAFCKLRQEERAKPQAKIDAEDVTVKACPCMTDRERTYLRREGVNLCSNRNCDGQTFPPYSFSFYTGQCTKPQESGVEFHMIATHYCSIVCQKEDV